MSLIQEGTLRMQERIKSFFVGFGKKKYKGGAYAMRRVAGKLWAPAFAALLLVSLVLLLIPGVRKLGVYGREGVSMKQRFQISLD